MKKTRFHFLVAAVLFSTVSCSDTFDTSFFDKEIEDPEFPISGIPIGYVNYTATQLFEELNEDLTVATGTDDIITFSYSQTLDGGENTDFVSVDDQNAIGNITLDEIPVNGTYNGPDITTPTQEKIAQAVLATNNGVELTNILFSGGNFDIKITNKVDSDIQIVFTINSLIKNGTPYTHTFNLSNDTPLDSETSPLESLDGYELVLNDNNNSNTISITSSMTLMVQDGDEFNDTSGIDYDINFSNMVIKSAEGDFKQSAFNVSSQSFDMDFFNEIGEGSLIFEEPILKLSATNEYGFPIGIKLEGISTDATSNNILEINAPGIDPSDNIAENTDTATAGDYYAMIAAGSNTAVSSEITLNSNNSNLAALLNEKPTQFILNVAGTSNPNSTTTNSNFFNISNTMSVNVDVELPLHVTFDDVTFNPDPIELDLDDAIKDNAKKLSLRLATKNTIPFNGSINLDFLDTNGTSLFTKNVEAIVAAPVDANGFSTYTLDANNNLKNANGAIIEANVPMVGDDFAVTFDESEIEDLGNATEVKISIVFDTDINRNGTATAVKVKSTDQVRIDLALRGDLKLSNN